MLSTGRQVKPRSLRRHALRTPVAAQSPDRQYDSAIWSEGVPVTLALEMFAIAPATGKANLSPAQRDLLVGKARWLCRGHQALGLSGRAHHPHHPRRLERAARGARGPPTTACASIGWRRCSAWSAAMAARRTWWCAPRAATHSAGLMPARAGPQPAGARGGVGRSGAPPRARRYLRCVRLLRRLRSAPRAPDRHRPGHGRRRRPPVPDPRPPVRRAGPAPVRRSVRSRSPAAATAISSKAPRCRLAGARICAAPSRWKAAWCA